MLPGMLKNVLRICCQSCVFESGFTAFSGVGNGNRLQYSWLENPTDRGAWWAIVHRVARSQTWLLACMHMFLRITWVIIFPGSSAGKQSACNAGDPDSIAGSGRSPGEGIVFLDFPCGSAGKESTCSVGDLGLISGFDLQDLIPWRRERLPTPVFWPGEFHELYIPWGCKESDITEQLSAMIM